MSKDLVILIEIVILRNLPFRTLVKFRHRLTQPTCMHIITLRGIDKASYRISVRYLPKRNTDVLLTVILFIPGISFCLTPIFLSLTLENRYRNLIKRYASGYVQG